MDYSAGRYPLISMPIGTSSTSGLIQVLKMLRLSGDLQFTLLYVVPESWSALGRGSFILQEGSNLLYELKQQ